MAEEEDNAISSSSAASARTKRRGTASTITSSLTSDLFGSDDNIIDTSDNRDTIEPPPTLRSSPTAQRQLLLHEDEKKENDPSSHSQISSGADLPAHPSASAASNKASPPRPNKAYRKSDMLLFTIIILTLFITYAQTSYLNETYHHIKFQIRFYTLLLRAMYNLISVNRRKKTGLGKAADSLKNHNTSDGSRNNVAVNRTLWPDPPLDLFHNSTKLIWAYWHSGPDSLSPLGNVSLQSWKAHHPSWKIIILSDTNYQQYIPSSHIPSTFELLKVQFRSDIVRLSVLARYGGAYLDMTTLLVKSLDGIWESELKRVEEGSDGGDDDDERRGRKKRVYPRIFVPTVLELGTKSIIDDDDDDESTADDSQADEEDDDDDQQQQSSSLSAAAGLVTNSVILSPQPNNPILLKFLSRILQYSENPASTANELKSRPEFKRVLPYMNSKDQLGILAGDGTLLYSAHLWIFTDLILFDEEMEAGRYFVDLPALRWTYDFIILPHTLARFDDENAAAVSTAACDSDMKTASTSCSSQEVTTKATIEEQLQNERIHTWDTWQILKHVLWGMVPWQEFDDPNLVDYTIQNVVMFKTSTDGGSLQNQRSYKDLMDWNSSFGRLYRRAMEGTGMNATLEGARLFGYGAPRACSFELDDDDVKC